MNLSVIRNAMTRPAFRAALLGKKYTPTILIGVGVIGVVGAAVMACKATVKADPVIKGLKEELKDVHDARDDAMERDLTAYTSKQYEHDLASIYFKYGVAFVRLYAPAIIIGGLSITALIGSHGIMAKRNTALAVAYKGAEEAYAAYRARVREELGEDKERDIRAGIGDGEPMEGDDGRFLPQRTKKDDPSKYSQHARIFDESCGEWQKNPEYNLLFLRTQQAFANDKLRLQGHLFLNEVYDMLGFPRTQSGAVVGWILQKGRENFVDFGIFDLQSEKARDFVNGYERSVVLDFNVQPGTIFDLI